MAWIGVKQQSMQITAKFIQYYTYPFVPVKAIKIPIASNNATRMILWRPAVRLLFVCVSWPGDQSTSCVGSCLRAHTGTYIYLYTTQLTTAVLPPRPSRFSLYLVMFILLIDYSSTETAEEKCGENQQVRAARVISLIQLQRGLLFVFFFSFFFFFFFFCFFFFFFFLST